MRKLERAYRPAAVLGVPRAFEGRPPVATPASPDINALVMAAEHLGATVVRTPAAIVVVFARATAERLSVAQAAEIACCTERRVRDAVRAGELDAAEVSERAVSITRGALEAWLTSKPARVRVAKVQDDEAEVERRLRRVAK